MLKGFTIVAAAAAMVTVPVAASAAQSSASAAQLTTARAATPLARKDRANAETSTLLNIGILAALVVGVLLAVDGGDDDTPDSN